MSSAAEKPIIKGTVKWFSNKKGFGFITPAEGSPTDQDVFVHQSSIKSDGYRTLDEGWKVEFTIGDDGGRAKAENVTGPGGGPCDGPRRQRPRSDHPRQRRPYQKQEDGEGVNGGRRRAPRNNYDNRRGPRPTEPHWHASLSDGVKGGIEEKGIRTTTGTIDVSFEASRVKLGTGGYSSLAHADGILAEGTFKCEPDGKASMHWDKCIIFKDGKWILVESDPRLVTALSLADDKVVAVKSDETAQSLWGDAPTDPRTALEENGFKMRRVVLTPRNNPGR